MLPPTSVGNPPAATISPASAVVVVLPFEPVMATMLPGKKLRRQLDFADHGFAARARLHQRRRIHRNARADHDQILFLEGALAVAAGFDRNAVIEQQREFPCRTGQVAWCRRR